MKEKLMTFRLPVEIDIEIERLAKLEDSDKSKLIRELIVFPCTGLKLVILVKCSSITSFQAKAVIRPNATTTAALTDFFSSKLNFFADSTTLLILFFFISV